MAVLHPGCHDEVIEGEYSRIRLAHAGDVRLITLADPAVGNGLDPFVLEAENVDALRVVDRDRAVRAIVLAGDGDDRWVGLHHDRSRAPRYPQDGESTAAERLGHGLASGGMWEALDKLREQYCAGQERAI